MKRSTNLSRGHTARLDAASVADLAAALGITADDLRPATPAPATPTLYRLAYKRRVGDPWQTTPAMELRAIPLARANLLARYSIVIRQWQNAAGEWIG